MPMRASLSGLLNKFSSQAAGHVAVIFSLAVVPIAVVAGFAMDFQVVATKKNKAQHTLDSAIIAGSRKMQEAGTPQEVALLVRTYFQSAMASNTGPSVVCADPEVTINGQDISATTVCSQATSLSAIAGINKLDFVVESASTFGIGMIDVAFVFDVSGSMIGSRMTALKEAAVVAVDQLLPDEVREGHEDDIRIAMVAYNDSLNAGDFFQAATGQSPSQVHRYYHSYYRRWYNIPYTTTCVFQREGTAKFNDDPPGLNKYVTAADYGERNDCRNSKPVPLTTDRDTLVNYVQALDPEGGTAGHLGVAWGWYMISPAWKHILPSAPREYDEPDTAKAMILMTDGAFNATHTNNQGSSSWQAKQLCDNIKAKGVVIYTVAFQAPQAGKDVLEYCASGPEFAFKPENGQQLTQSYQAIATSISDLRITN